MLYHAGVSWAHGALLSVDTFFTLSGFLITTLLLAEWRRHGWVSIPRFWQRRATRLLPALFVMVAVVALTARWWAEPGPLAQLRNDGAATLIYATNWEQVRSGVGYFDAFAEPSPLRHAWTLAIEEQYYLVWPVVAAVVLSAAGRWARRRGTDPFEAARRAILWTSVAGALASAAWMAWLHSHGASVGRTYFGTDTRAHAILVGAGLAALLAGTTTSEQASVVATFNPRRWTSASAHGRDAGTPQVPHRNRRLLLGGVAAAVVSMGAWTLDLTDAQRNLGGHAAAGLLTAVVIAAAVLGGDSLLRRTLSFRPLRWLGTISYGAYLWHWPVYQLLDEERTGLDGAALLSLRMAVSIGAAALSWNLIERPAMRARVSGRAMAGAALGAVAVLLVAVLVGTSGAGPTQQERYQESLEETARPPLVPAAPPTPAPPRVEVLGDASATALAAALAAAPPPADGSAPTFELTKPATEAAGTPGPCYLLHQDPTNACADWRTAWPGRAASADLTVLAWGYQEALLLGSVDLYSAPVAVDGALEEVVTLLATPERPLALVSLPAQLHTDEARAASTWTPEQSFVIEQVTLALHSLATRFPDRVRVLDLGDLLCPAGVVCSPVAAGLHVGPTIDATLAPTVASWLGAQVPALLPAHGAPVAADYTRTLVVGDSVGWTLGYGWYGDPETGAGPADDDRVRIWNRAYLACELGDTPRVESGELGPAKTGCVGWRDEWRADAMAFDADVSLVVVGAWDLFDREIGGRVVPFGDPAHDQYLLATLESAVASLTAGGAPVAFVTQSARQGGPDVFTSGMSDTERATHWNGLLGQVAAAHPGVVHVIDLATHLCPSAPCPEQLDGATLRYDELHLTTDGAHAVAAWLAPQLRALHTGTPN